ncbi:hypothetical protein NDU88_001925 [Pleurodeles waltl]|uniref:Uncharacterized protein n=1 Tax=Pleurodeles waltl TaxID=8319 RepID=A0AAV7KRI3_PLEWA|nr:hypothetical protein NDU88_001925 [Pleurodeles waltl]
MWSPPFGGSDTSVSSKGTASPPPGKRTRKVKGRRERTETAAPKEVTPATSPATTARGGKGPRAPSKERKDSRAERTTTRSAEQEGPTSPIPAARDDTKGPRTPSPKGPDTARSEGE